MTEFTASNGVTVKKYGAGLTLTGDPVDLDRLREKLQAGSYGDITPSMQDALREYFQHERDEELGRWRSRIDPTWTAVHEKGYPTVQFRNDDGMREFSIYPDRSNMHAWSIELQEIGMEYLEDRAEKKPWEQAKTGEGWVLRFPAGPAVALRRSDGLFYDYEGNRLHTERVSEARRIWPEEDGS